MLPYFIPLCPAHHAGRCLQIDQTISNLETNTIVAILHPTLSKKHTTQEGACKLIKLFLIWKQTPMLPYFIPLCPAHHAGRCLQIYQTISNLETNTNVAILHPTLSAHHAGRCLQID
jgi:hypothetical protein